ncbi:MAG: hypothetical protein ACLPXZ_04985 [Mycobacterium sp.]
MRQNTCEILAFEPRSYLKNDIGPVLGELPLAGLTRDDIAQWMQAMSTRS